MKVFFFTKYTRAGASSRYRSYQYFSAFEQAGFDIVVSPLFNGEYLSHKYGLGRPHKALALLACVRRLWQALNVPTSAVIVIEKELLPWMPAFLERLLVWRRCKLVVDYDDALFHQYDTHPNKWVRAFLGKKIATVMRLSHVVVAGNAYLAEYARSAGATRVEVFPTVIDTINYTVRKFDDSPREFTIGWIGSPSTTHYLKGVAPALAELSRYPGVRIRLVGASLIDLPGVNADWVPWSEGTEVAEVGRFDVGIMPLPDEPWARGKCGFKLIQYMACGVPVIASPVGVNSEIVTDGFNGVLASDTEEWVNRLLQIRRDPLAARRMGLAGRQRVEERFCLRVTSELWIDLLRSVIGTRPSKRI